MTIGLIGGAIIVFIGNGRAFSEFERPRREPATTT